MKNGKVLLSIALFLVHTTVTSFSFHVAGLSQFTSQMKGIGEGFKEFGEGLAQSFGMDPPGYSYSFRVFNNARTAVNVEAKRIKKFQGMMIKRDSIKTVSLDPGTDTGTSGFHGIGLYFEIELGGFFSDSIVNLVPAYKEDSKVYCYNVYEDNSGTHGEMIGADQTTSPEFLGTIYNSVPATQKLTFVYAGENFTIDLDKDSFNTLHSDTTIPNCMRPANGVNHLDFGTAGSIILPAQGLGSGTKKDGKIDDVHPFNYHYQIFGTADAPTAVTNGFNPGNFPQPVSGRVRDITPVRCLVWNKSADQVTGATDDFVSADITTRSVWVAYSTQGWTNTTRTLTNTIMTKVPLGDAVQFYFIRPSLDASLKVSGDELLQTKDLKPPAKFAQENTIDTLGVQLKAVDIFSDITTQAPKTAKAPLFIVSLDTTDDSKAKIFLQKLLDGTIKIPQGPSLASATLTEDIKNSLLVDKLTTTAGQLEDTQTGVTGYLLAYDVFTPYGNSSGPYYYTVQPPQFMVAPILSTVMSYVDQKKFGSDDQITALKKTIAQWIKEAVGKPTKKAGIQAVYDDVLTFLQANGNITLFELDDNFKSDISKLTWAGNMGLNMITSGPNSVVNTPMQWLAGVNNYVYNGANMPTARDASGNKQVIWKPNNTVDLSGQKVKYLPPQPDLTSSSTATTDS